MTPIMNSTVNYGLRVVMMMSRLVSCNNRNNSGRDVDNKGGLYMWGQKVYGRSILLVLL